MITRIPEEQLCQSFDSRMIQTEQTLKNHNTNEQPNTSCVAPAYVYVEGKHGNKFLCDTHYYYEIYMNRITYAAPNHSWKEIQQYMVDERERVKETFAKDVTTTETVGQYCFAASNKGRTTNTEDDCLAETFVKSTAKNGDIMFFCNFHFRKIYYRYYSNGAKYEDFYDILDERYRMDTTIVEESLKLRSI
jgi:hypothetical protein